MLRNAGQSPLIMQPPLELLEKNVYCVEGLQFYR